MPRVKAKAKKGKKEIPPPRLTSSPSPKKVLEKSPPHPKSRIEKAQQQVEASSPPPKKAPAKRGRKPNKTKPPPESIIEKEQSALEGETYVVKQPATKEEVSYEEQVEEENQVILPKRRRKVAEFVRTLSKAERLNMRVNSHGESIEEGKPSRAKDR